MLKNFFRKSTKKANDVQKIEPNLFDEDKADTGDGHYSDLKVEMNFALNDDEIKADFDGISEPLNRIANANSQQKSKKTISSVLNLSKLFKSNKPIDIQNNFSEVKRPKVIETIALILMAPNNSYYNGRDIFNVIKNHQLPLILNSKGIFVQTTTTSFGEETEFCIANMVNSGSFEAPRIMEMRIPGLLFLMDIPSPDYQKDTFDQMLKTAARFGNALGGTLFDQNKQFVTAEKIEDLRQYITNLDEKIWLEAEGY